MYYLGVTWRSGTMGVAPTRALTSEARDCGARALLFPSSDLDSLWSEESGGGGGGVWPLVFGDACEPLSSVSWLRLRLPSDARPGSVLSTSLRTRRGTLLRWGRGRKERKREPHSTLRCLRYVTRIRRGRYHFFHTVIPF